MVVVVVAAVVVAAVDQDTTAEAMLQRRALPLPQATTRQPQTLVPLLHPLLLLAVAVAVAVAAAPHPCNTLLALPLVPTVLPINPLKHSDDVPIPRINKLLIDR